MTTKLRNIIFISVCICAFSIAFIYLGAKATHILPASFINATYSTLEGAKLQGRPSVSLENIKNGKFQSETEKWITTKVPKRDSVMLFNARAQRGAIAVANIAIGFEAIPTYFGSKYSYTESLNVVAATSVQKSEDISQKMGECAEAINKFVDTHPNLSYTLTIPDRVCHSEANPSFSLVSEPFDDEWRHSEFVDKLDERIKYVDLSYSNSSDYYNKYFRTDHHWNIEGAYESFRKVMGSSYPELEAIEFDPNSKVTYQTPKFYGTASRLGLCIPNESDLITDYITDLSDVTIKFNGKEVSSDEVEDVESYVNKSYTKEKLKDRHGDYFHGNNGLVTYEKNNSSNRNLLVFRDSYLNSCDRFYSFSFDKVITVDQEKFKGNIQELLDEYNITDVLFMQNDARYYEEKSKPNALIALLAS